MTEDTNGWMASYSMNWICSSRWWWPEMCYTVIRSKVRHNWTIELNWYGLKSVRKLLVLINSSFLKFLSSVRQSKDWNHIPATIFSRLGFIFQLNPLWNPSSMIEDENYCPAVGVRSLTLWSWTHFSYFFLISHTIASRFSISWA